MRAIVRSISSELIIKLIIKLIVLLCGLLKRQASTIVHEELKLTTLLYKLAALRRYRIVWPPFFDELF